LSVAALIDALSCSAITRIVIYSISLSQHLGFGLQLLDQRLHVRHLHAGTALGAIALAAVVWFRSRREMLEGVKRASASEIGHSLVVALPALALPLVIRAAVVEGIATATEVATIGVAYTCVTGLLLYRRFDWRRLYPILVETASLSGAILIIIGCATAIGWTLTQSGFSAQLAALMMAAPGGQLGFLAISAVAFVILGSFLECIPAIVLFGPLLFPIARAMGISDVALCDGRGVRDGTRSLRPATRPWLLCGVRRQQGRPGHGDAAGVALSRGARRRLDHHRCGSVGVGRLPEMKAVQK
jgi:TRAP-type mannitol/chloroaromatic compound transport system permease large subunit